jgi:hypothetical protein
MVLVAPAPVRDAPGVIRQDPLHTFQIIVTDTFYLKICRERLFQIELLVCRDVDVPRSFVSLS